MAERFVLEALLPAHRRDVYISPQLQFQCWDCGGLRLTVMGVFTP